jgi:hypothetical protein
MGLKMIACIRDFIKFAALVAMLISTASVSAATIPRAWLVAKGDAQAVLVGESHVGTPVEYDDYFRTVVKPSYAIADVAVMETYFGPEQTRNESFERGAACFDDPMGKRTPRVRLAFDTLITATHENGLEVPNWLEGWELVPQFLFTSLYFPSFTHHTLGPAYDAAIEAKAGLGISFRLRGKGKLTKKTIGLDRLKDWRTHFCSAGAGDRADFVADQTLKLARLLRLKQSDPSYTSLGKLSYVGGQIFADRIRCIDQTVPCAIDDLSASDQILLQKGWLMPLSPGSFEIYIKKRTRTWVPLIVKTISAHHKSFIVVGALHLPDLRVGDHVEPGLISLLREQGFSVTRISSASDISANFLSPSWFDRIRSALTSL